MMHECSETFETQKIDDCFGKGENRCFGNGPMYLRMWYMDTDGQENHYDNWAEMEVNFCPFCGLKAELQKP